MRQPYVVFICFIREETNISETAQPRTVAIGAEKRLEPLAALTKLALARVSKALVKPALALVPKALVKPALAQTPKALAAKAYVARGGTALTVRGGMPKVNCSRATIDAP